MAGHRTSKILLTDSQRRMLTQLCQSDLDVSLPELLNWCEYENIEPFESDLRALHQLGFLKPCKYLPVQQKNGRPGDRIRLTDQEFSGLFPLSRYLVADETGRWHWLIDGKPRHSEVGIRGVIGLVAATREGVSFFWGQR